jgi:endonuclease/exonuclease/phosphatase (EEP) superfamily protein YafD
MLRELRGAITALALVVCGVLLAVSVDFGLPGQSLLQSLRFHIAAVLLALMLLLFLGGAWRRGLLFLLAFALSAGQGAAIVYRQQETRISAEAVGSKPLFRLLSFNLLATNENGEKIAEFIASSGADIVLLMEAAPIGPHLGKLLATYPYQSGCTDGPECGGVMLLSRTPLEAVTVTSLSQVWRDRLITAATTIDGQRISVVGAHVVKPYFDEFADEEVYRLGETIGRLTGPLVLAGDFNAAAWSNSVDRLAWQAKLAPGPAYPATWPVRLGPLGVPIDNVFTGAPLVIEQIEALDDGMGSNHRGLMAEIGLVGG